MVADVANSNLLFLFDLVLIPQSKAHRLQPSKLLGPKTMTTSRN
jgi:hypothetical protein